MDNTDINEYDSDDDQTNNELENLFEIEKIEMENDEHILNMNQIIQDFLKEKPSFILDKMRLEHLNDLIEQHNNLSLNYQPQAEILE